MPSYSCCLLSQQGYARKRTAEWAENYEKDHAGDNGETMADFWDFNRGRNRG